MADISRISGLLILILLSCYGGYRILAGAFWSLLVFGTPLGPLSDCSEGAGAVDVVQARSE